MRARRSGMIVNLGAAGRAIGVIEVRDELAITG